MLNDNLTKEQGFSFGKNSAKVENSKTDNSQTTTNQIEKDSKNTEQRGRVIKKNNESTSSGSVLLTFGYGNSDKDLICN